MKPLLLLAAVSAIPLAACSGASTTRAALECPAVQGKLSRTSAAADGRSCTYASNDGAEVTLSLMPVTGGPYATLDRLEATLLAETETRQPASGEAAASPAPAQEARKSASEARRAEEEAASDATHAETASADARDDGVDVRMENGKVVVTEGGSTTRVNLPGIHIEADGRDDSARVRIGPLHVDASGDAAVMRVRRDVRLKGEALSREKRGVRATYIVGDRKGEDRAFVGYEAGGPKVGPLAVAVVRASRGMDDSDDIYDDVKRLVRRNGGV